MGHNRSVLEYIDAYFSTIDRFGTFCLNDYLYHED